MRIANNYSLQYTSNYKKTAKAGKSSGTFADTLQKIKSSAPVKPTQYAVKFTAPRVESIKDIPYEWEARLEMAVRASANLDTRGMTKTEILNRVESAFKHYLGQDALIYAHDWKYEWRIVRSFEDALTAHGIPSGGSSHIFDPKTFREARGFIGMSSSDIRAAVRSKFPKVMTLREVFAMNRELIRLGLEEAARGVCFMSAHIMTALHLNESLTVEERHRIHAELLGMPADFDAVKASFVSMWNAITGGQDHMTVGGRVYPLDDSFQAWTASQALENFKILLGMVGRDGDMTDALLEMLESSQERRLRENRVFNLRNEVLLHENYRNT